jgi:hypothetical protein
LRSQGSARWVRTICGRFWSKMPVAPLGGKIDCTSAGGNAKRGATTENDWFALKLCARGCILSVEATTWVTAMA